MSRLNLIIGPVGAGKSTFARALADEHGAVRLTLDAWMAALYGEDARPADRIGWYQARVERCLSVIRELTSQLVAAGTPVVLEIEEKGETFSVVVPPEFFELASDLWEPPEGAEIEDRAIEFR